jgi:uncharacterized membrane protein (DUF4010 family)
MEQTDLFLRFGVAIAIGFLVGLQREFAHREFGERELITGERTLALMGLIGAGAAFAADALGSPWAFVAVVSGVAVLLAVGYFIDASRGAIGMTTEAAAIVVVLAGALAYWGYLAIAVAIGVVTTVILSLKLQTDSLVRRLSPEDIYATLKFAVISAIVLPLLPNVGIGPPPLDVLNPYKIWLMVVFISAISFLGYVLIKLVGQREGIGLTGFLGGLVSSTAVTLTFTQRSREQSLLARPFALAIIISWTMMFARVLVEVAVVNLRLLPVVLPPIAAAGGAGLLYGAYLFLSHRQREESSVPLNNPFELGPAVKFGLFYAFILVLARAAQLYVGEAGIYLSSLVSGLADVDAITLSMASLSAAPDGLPLTVASRAIVIATVSNTVVKGGLVLLTGAPSLRKVILPGFLLILALALVLGVI